MAHDFAKVRAIAKEVGASFPYLTNDFTTCDKIIGFTRRNERMRDNIMNVGELALDYYSIDIEKRAGYRHFIAAWFDIAVDRRGRPLCLPKKKPAVESPA